MRAGLLIPLVSLAACGGGAASTPQSTTPPTPAAVSAVDFWAAVMKPGAVFTFDDEMEDSGLEVSTMTATVTAVEDVDGGRAVILAWTEDGAPYEVSSLPGVIVVGDAGVTFYRDRDAMVAREDPLTFPAVAAPAKLPGGLYIDDGVIFGEGELCYGEGPEEGAGECEDTCYAHLCVHPTHGLTGGEGTWWPDYMVFHRSDLPK